jgi:putative acetyltransferase
MTGTTGALAAEAAMPAATAVLRIESDDLTRPAVIALLHEHLQNMFAVTPAESVHALDLDALRAADVTFWSVWDGDTLVGCGALKELDARHGEIKSMRTPQGLRRRGAGRAVLAHILDQARQRGYARVSLETGATAPFEPARRLYESFGFRDCGPFAEYTDDPHSVFMTRELDPEPKP